MRLSRLIPALLAGATPAAQAQAPSGAGEDPALRVFLDCQGGRCDFDFFRTEITWVNWVRDRATAQVHLLITTQPTGGGGREYTMHFIGLQSYRGREDELRVAVSPTATADEERKEVARRMGLGLVGYAARLSIAPRLSVRYDQPPEQAGVAQQPRDPWNFWVFRLSANGSFNGESRSRSSNLFGSVRATRITDDWKLRLFVRGSRRTNHFTFDDGTTFESTTSSSGGEALLVRSLSQHWSAGVLGGADRSDQLNLDLAVRGGPGIEFNVWPYRQSTRRQLTILYEVGVTAFNYTDTTIFNTTQETLADQRLTVSLIQQQPWGSSQVSVQGAAFFTDLAKNRLVVFGGLGVRVVRGLDLNLSASYSRVRDQLYLPKEGATDEEVLLRLRQLQTAYRYFVSVGVSYTFGSIFNNVVNSRFSGSSGGFEFGF